MTRTQRRNHLFLWLALLPALIVGLLLAWSVRPHWPVDHDSNGASIAEESQP